LAVASVESGEQIKIANGSNCPTCANWYVNDVLYYASFYCGGTLLGDPNTCGRGSGNPKLPSLTNERVAKLLACAKRTMVTATG
jgi:hypothetical protein